MWLYLDEGGREPCRRLHHSMISVFGSQELEKGDLISLPPPLRLPALYLWVCIIYSPYKSHQYWGEKFHQRRAPYALVRLDYKGVSPGAPTGPFVAAHFSTLCSHSAFGTVPNTLVLVYLVPGRTRMKPVTGASGLLYSHWLQPEWGEEHPHPPNRITGFHHEKVRVALWSNSFQPPQ